MDSVLGATTRRFALAIILDGKAAAAQARHQVASRAADFAQSHERFAGLVVVQVGADPASSIYVRNKRAASVEVGIESRVVPATCDSKYARLFSHTNQTAGLCKKFG